MLFVVKLVNYYTVTEKSEENTSLKVRNTIHDCAITMKIAQPHKL